MGLVTICKYKRAKKPLCVEQAGVNLYSLEELSWFVYRNICLVDRQFFDERLCRWLSEEIGYPELAQRIRNGIQAGTNVQNLVLSVAGASDLFDGRKLQELKDRLGSLTGLSEQERRKLRADELLDSRKEWAAIEEYHRILTMHQNTRLGLSFYAAVWNNLGVCYARQFLFEDAAECFGISCEYEDNEDTRLREELAKELLAGKLPGGGKRRTELTDPQKKLLAWEREYRAGQTQM